MLILYVSVNFVDYKGCVEKNELRQKVQRLWKDNEQNETVADTIHEKGVFFKNTYRSTAFKK